MMRVGSSTGTATSSSKFPDESGPMTNNLPALILELGELDGVLPCVNDRTVTDPVLAGRVRNLHIVKDTLTMGHVKSVLTLEPGCQ